jgi:PTH1 family peptidyl-tRNA hydrolase
MKAEIRLLVGLGNPGSQYSGTRHNAGCWFLDGLASLQGVTWRKEGRFQGEVAKVRLAGADCWLLKPATFMNHSGRSVAALANYYRLSVAEMLVAHDELDLSPGTLRLKQGGGHGGHNGLRDIIAAMGGAGFWRLRIGIGHPGHRDAVTPYVLASPSKAERQSIDVVLASAADEMDAICAGKQQAVINRLHQKNEQ